MGGDPAILSNLIAFPLVLGAFTYRAAATPGCPALSVSPVPVAPICGILLMTCRPLVTWLRLVAWLLIGLAICFTHGPRQSAPRHPAMGRT